MNVKIEIQNELKEEEIIIRSPALTERTQKIYDLLVKNLEAKQEGIVFFQGNKEFYFPVNEVMFFETDEGLVSAHTKNQVFQTTYRLYELEEILPGNFMRISKSTILNINHIYSITKNVTASSEVQFFDSHKQVFVSRHYYKPLKIRLDEKRRNI